MIVLSGPGARSRQLQIPRGWPVWACLLSLLSVSVSLFAGRQARAWFDPHAHRPGLAMTHEEPAPMLVSLPTPAVERPARRKRTHLRPREQMLPSAAPVPSARMPREQAEQEPKRRGGPLTELRLLNVNGGHTLQVRPFDEQGLPDAQAFGQLKEFMRCRRTGSAHDMNPSLVALLSSIAQHFDGAVLHVISGHRAADDVTTRPSSQHTRGTAADIRIPGVSIETLAKAAHELGARGVGVYPLSRFVHVDVREQPYYWRDVGTGAVATRAPL